jgi:hypothetical protein
LSKDPQLGNLGTKGGEFSPEHVTGVGGTLKNLLPCPVQRMLQLRQFFRTFRVMLPVHHLERLNDLFEGANLTDYRPLQGNSRLKRCGSIARRVDPFLFFEHFEIRTEPIALPDQRPAKSPEDGGALIDLGLTQFSGHSYPAMLTPLETVP